MPTIVTKTQAEPEGRLAEVAAAVREYHVALDQRQHGGVACDRAMKKIEETLGLEWRAPRL